MNERKITVAMVKTYHCTNRGADECGRRGLHYRSPAGANGRTWGTKIRRYLAILGNLVLWEMYLISDGNNIVKQRYHPIQSGIAVSFKKAVILCLLFRLSCFGVGGRKVSIPRSR